MKKRGFTLIELMVVVVIIGILAAIAIPNFIKIVEKAKIASVKANMHTLQVTVESLSIAHSGAYPTAGNDGDDISNELPGNFKNPYRATEIGTDCIDFQSLAATEGRVGYSCTGNSYEGDNYTITGFGKDAIITDLTLNAGK